MSEPVLNSARVVALVGQRVAASVPQHVHMDLEGQRSSLADPLYQAADGIGSEWGR
jgi:hypothetical protein